MPGFRAVDPKQSFPELEERILARWASATSSSARWRTAPRRRGLELLRGAADRQRPPRLPPRPRPRLQGHLPPLPLDARLPGPAQGGLGLPRPPGRARGRKGARDHLQAGDRGATASPSSTALPRASVFEYVEEWNRLTERIGFWIDLDDPYVTLDDDYIESVWWSLRKLWDSELLYEGHKVVPYCPRCGTAALLARGRARLRGRRGPLDLREISAVSRCRRNDGSGDAPDERSSCWSGRRRRGPCPATRPSRSAPDVTYVRAKLDDETLILAAPLVERVLGEEAEILDTLPGLGPGRPPLRGPVFDLTDREEGGFPILAGDFVTTEDGTGLVHIAPAFGEDDYAVAAENGIFDPTKHTTLYNPVGLDGNFDDRVVGFEGRFVKDPEVTRGLIDDLDRARPALPRAGLRARLPALLALRHAAPLLREVELVRRDLARARRPARQQRDRSGGTPSTSSTAASANGSRTTSTGRSPATATGGRRCRSGSAAARAATSAPASARSPSCASAPAATSPTTSTAPTSTRSSCPARSAAARCAGSSR